MKTLIEGLFPKDRLLDYVRHFIAFEVVNDKIEKKGAKYHQYFGVRFAVEEAIRALRGTRVYGRFVVERFLHGVRIFLGCGREVGVDDRPEGCFDVGSRRVGCQDGGAGRGHQRK